MSFRRRTFVTAAAAATYLPLTRRFAHAQQTKTLLLAAPTTPEGLDGDVLKPGTQETVTQVYEGLIRYGRVERDGRTWLDPAKIEGHLAESWAASDDGKRYVFTLRAGVKSPYGNELSAADVEWGWNKSFAQKRTGNFIAGVSNVTGVKALSQREVEFTLSAPSSIFLACLTLYTPGIYDSTEVKKHTSADDPWALKWIESHTAGYGAYHLDQLQPDQQAVFVANPNYFRGQPYFEKVIYKAIASGASRVALLRAGQVQWIDRATVQQVVELRKNAKVKVQDADGRAILAVRMNCSIKPFDDVRVRRAFNFAIDQDKLRQAVLLDTGQNARSIIPPMVEGSDPSLFAYGHDPDKARALLAEAGFEKGLEVELTFSDISWWEEQMAVQVADQLRAVGVTAKPRRITASELRARVAPAKQDVPFFTLEDGPIVLDPVYTMSLLAMSTGVSNRARYKNPALDALVAQAQVTLDKDNRGALMHQAQKIWMDDAPWIITAYAQVFESMSPAVSGWVPHPDDQERWVDLRMS
jgi:ABC-type transport system substrate-binding protein